MMEWVQSWGAVTLAGVAMFTSLRAYVYSKRAATAEMNRRRAARIAGEQRLPGIAYRMDHDGGVQCLAVRPGEPIPTGYLWTPAAKNGVG
jgi:hypothetical protein